MAARANLELLFERSTSKRPAAAAVRRRLIREARRRPPDERRIERCARPARSHRGRAPRTSSIRAGDLKRSSTYASAAGAGTTISARPCAIATGAAIEWTAVSCARRTAGAVLVSVAKAGPSKVAVTAVIRCGSSGGRKPHKLGSARPTVAVGGAAGPIAVDFDLTATQPHAKPLLPPIVVRLSRP